MYMTTIAIKQQAIPSYSLPTQNYNKYTFMSLVLVALFILYFFVPHVGVLNSVFNLSIVFVVFIPLAAFVLSLISVRQISQTHGKGMVLSYIALGVTSLYFMVALAVPVVIVGFYILYSYVL